MFKHNRHTTSRVTAKNRKLTPRQKDQNFSWRELLIRLQQLFGDQQVLETATEEFFRIQKGSNQFFDECLKEFNYKVAMCGQEDTYTPLS